ncbi:hypothetical protein V2J09_020439 [Rumex salicifolius]
MGIISFTLLLLALGCNARPFFPFPSKQGNTNKQPLQTSRPFNIAHRGSNGELPEETYAAYMRAIDEGADFIETDILASKDGVLICFHDPNLDDTTDIADHKEFADRKTTYQVQGLNITGFFTVHVLLIMLCYVLTSSQKMVTVDFTWAELSTLRAKQRFSFRDQQYNGMFPIITFEEYIAIALDAPRIVGIYPEIKNPVFINQHVKWPNGAIFEDMFIATLKKYGYKGKYLSEDWLNQPCFIQSFDASSLVHIHNSTDLPKLFLIDDVTIITEDTNMTYAEITSDEYLDYISQYVEGIGPWKDTVVPVVNNYLLKPTDLIAKAHARGLQVHPYTYRLENQYIHFEFHQDPYEEFDYWINKMGVDGLFTDFPGALHNFQKWSSPLKQEIAGKDGQPRT